MSEQAFQALAAEIFSETCACVYCREQKVCKALESRLERAARLIANHFGYYACKGDVERILREELSR